MTWLLLPVAALVIVMAACLFFGLAAASHIDLGDTDDIDPDDDEPEPEPAAITATTVYDWTFIYPIPPFAIRHLGPSGQHDRYPLTEGSRQFWIDMLDASWELPAKEPTQ